MTPTVRPIVVGIDGSDDAIAAARWATIEAAGRDLAMTLVYVVASDSDYSPVPDSSEVELRYARDAIEAAHAAVAAQDDSVKVETQVLQGRLNRTLIAMSARADTFVVGAVGAGFFPRMLLGSTAASLAQGAACPTAIIRHMTTDRTTGPVLVAVDESADNDSVVRVAMREAKIRKADLIAVHAWRVRSGFTADRFALAAGEHRARHLLGARRDTWKTAFPDVHASAIAVQGSSAMYLEELSATAQLVVVGGEGHTPTTNGLLGSTSHSLIYHSDCSVLVVRPTR